MCRKVGTKVSLYTSFACRSTRQCSFSGTQFAHFGTLWPTNMNGAPVPPRSSCLVEVMTRSVPLTSFEKQKHSSTEDRGVLGAGISTQGEGQVAGTKEWSNEKLGVGVKVN